MRWRKSSYSHTTECVEVARVVSTPPEIRFSDVVDLIECPFCGAGPGTSCGTSSGYVALQTHSARLRAASKALDRLCAERRPKCAAEATS